MMPTKRYYFSLVELLIVIAIIAILAGMMFPVFYKARAKARMTSCMDNLKQIGAGIIMYRHENDDFNVSWSSRLYPDYVKLKEVYLCPCDGNPEDTPANQWLARIDNDHNTVYDREGNTGMHENPNTDVGNVSYFYEFSDAVCTWNLNPPMADPYTWAELKEQQLRNGGDGCHDPGEGYDPSTFPVFRCLWHINNLKNYTSGIPNKALPVLNVGFAGNYFLSRGKWEDGVWTP